MRRDTLTFLLFLVGVVPFAGIIFVGYNVAFEADCKVDSDCGQESACLNGYCALLSRCEIPRPVGYGYGYGYGSPSYSNPYAPAYQPPASSIPPSYKAGTSAQNFGLSMARSRLILAQSRLRSAHSVLSSYRRTYRTYQRLWQQNPQPSYKRLLDTYAARIREYEARVQEARQAVALAQAQVIAAQRAVALGSTTGSASTSGQGASGSPAAPAEVVESPSSSVGTVGQGSPSSPASPSVAVNGSPTPSGRSPLGNPVSEPSPTAPKPVVLPLLRECPADSYCEATLGRCVRSAPRTTFFAHFHPGYWSYRAQYQTIVRSGGTYNRYRLASFRSGGLGFGK